MGSICSKGPWQGERPDSSDDERGAGRSLRRMLSNGDERGWRNLFTEDGLCPAHTLFTFKSFLNQIGTMEGTGGCIIYTDDGEGKYATETLGESIK